MIKFKKAPAGYIAQFFTDDKRPYTGFPNQGYVDNHFQDVTGEWCPTLADAVASVKKQKPKKIKKLQEKIEQLKTMVSLYQALLTDIENSSDNVLEERE